MTTMTTAVPLMEVRLRSPDMGSASITQYTDKCTKKDEGQVPAVTSPSNRVAQLYLQDLVPVLLFVSDVPPHGNVKFICKI
jgi:hypothetical protein